MVDLIHEITIPRYPSKIQLSSKRRAVYFQKKKHKDKLPKKYQNSRFVWDVNGNLFDTEEKCRVIKNAKSVGTPRYWAVNFQAIWNQQLKYQGRANITNKLKDIFRPFILPLRFIDVYPIKIEIFLFDVVMPVDVDNKGVIYTKVITDLLVNSNKGESDNKKTIQEDSSEFVNDTGRCKWIKVENECEIKMVIKIWKSNNLPI